jgi:hypothetical protein
MYVSPCISNKLNPVSQDPTSPEIMFALDDRMEDAGRKIITFYRRGLPVGVLFFYFLMIF